MKKFDIFTKIFFSVSVTLNTLVLSQIKSEDLRYQFNSKESASWGNAQYEDITNNVRGEKLIIRYFVDKNSNIYEFKKTTNYNLGPTKIGNLNSKSYSTGDTCYFGTNAACLSNITKTTTQYAIESCQLIKYARTDMIQSGTQGDINRYVLGSCINNKSDKGNFSDLRVPNQSKKVAISESKSLGKDPFMEWLINILLPIIAILGFIGAFRAVSKETKNK